MSSASSYELGLVGAHSGQKSASVVADPSPYSISVYGVTRDEVDAPNGSAYYLISATMSYAGDSKWTICMGCFEVIGNIGPPLIASTATESAIVLFPDQRANATLYVTSSTNEGYEVVAANGTLEQATVSSLPYPAKLIYTQSPVNITATIPRNYDNASLITKVGVQVKGPPGYSFQAIAAETAVINYSLFETVPPELLPYSVLPPGQMVSITIEVSNLGSFSECSDVAVSAIQDSAGFTISDVAPGIPIDVPCGGLTSPTDFSLDVAAPLAGYSGPLDFNVTLTEP